MLVIPTPSNGGRTDDAPYNCPPPSRAAIHLLIAATCCPSPSLSFFLLQGLQQRCPTKSISTLLLLGRSVPFLSINKAALYLRKLLSSTTASRPEGVSPSPPSTPPPTPPPAVHEPVPQKRGRQKRDPVTAPAAKRPRRTDSPAVAPEPRRTTRRCAVTAKAKAAQAGCN